MSKAGTRRTLHSKELTQPQTELHPSTFRVAEKLKTWKWRKGASTTIEAAVNESLLTYEAWVKHLHHISVKDQRVERFRKHVIHKLPTSGEMVLEWYTLIYSRFEWRRDFSGDLVTHLWKPKHSLWRYKGQEYAVYYCGDPRLWDKLMEALDEG